MLKLTTLTAATSLLIASAALAQDVDPAIDLNGDGLYSFPEIGSFYPTLTGADFSTMDTSGDGLLDMGEVAAAQSAGLLPA